MSHDWFTFAGAPTLVSRGNKFLFGEQHLFAAKAAGDGEVNLVASVDPGKTWHIAKTGLDAHSYSLLDTSSGAAILSVSSRHVKNEKVCLSLLISALAHESYSISRLTALDLRLPAPRHPTTY